MDAMCSMPDFLFKPITKLDSTLANSWIAKAFVGLMAEKADEGDEDVVVASAANMRAMHDRVIADRVTTRARAEALDVDYRFGYGRIEGVTVDFLTRLYQDCPVGITWYTSDGDVFFGPKYAERIVKDMDRVRTEIINVPEATHADIYLRKDVWEAMHAKITEGRDAS
jgi:hypothetical protein